MFSKILTSILRWRRGQPKPPSLAVMLAVWYTASSFLIVAVVTGLLYFGLARKRDRSSPKQIMAR